jgi:hypothetical protein
MGNFSKEKGMDPMIVKVSINIIIEFLLSVTARNQPLSLKKNFASRFKTTKFAYFKG